jgi:hypothetical protein
LEALIAAREISIWFYKTFIDTGLEPGPFRPPPNPANAELALKRELESLRERNPLVAVGSHGVGWREGSGGEGKTSRAGQPTRSIVCTADHWKTPFVE